MPRDLKDLMQRTARPPNRGPDIGAIQRRGRTLKVRERVAAAGMVALAGAGIWGVVGALPTPDEPPPVQPAPQEFPRRMQPKDYAAAVAIEAMEIAGLRDPGFTYFDYQDIEPVTVDVGIPGEEVGIPGEGSQRQLREWSATFEKKSQGCDDVGGGGAALCIPIPDVIRVRVEEYRRYFAIQSIGGKAYAVDDFAYTSYFARADIERGWTFGDAFVEQVPSPGGPGGDNNMLVGYQWVGPLQAVREFERCEVKGHTLFVRVPVNLTYPSTEDERDGDGPIALHAPGANHKTQVDCGKLED